MEKGEKNGADERWEHHFLISSKNSFLRHNALIFGMLLQFFHRTPSSRFWGNFGVFYHFLGKKWGSVLSANEPSSKPGVKPYSLIIWRRWNIAHLYRSVKEDKRNSQPVRRSRKSNYLQFTENRYRRMSDTDFIKAFEADHEDETERFYTQIKKKFLPFFKSNMSRDDYEELQEQYECDEAYWYEWLDSCPELIGKLPVNVIWRLQADEKLQLLVHHPEQKELLLPMLKGEDIWAFILPMWKTALQKKAISFCPWETMTASQIRYMKLKSGTLKKFIESHKIG